MNRLKTLIACLPLLIVAACGDDDGFTCSLDDATELASSDWPMSRHDRANTGNSHIALGVDAPAAKCIFPDPPEAEPVAGAVADCEEGGDVIASTVIVRDDPDVVDDPERLILATQAGRVHVLEFTGEEVRLEEEIDLGSPVNTPLLGADGSIFVTETSGVTRRFSETGVQLFSASLGADVVIAPNIGLDGVIYTGTAAGIFSAVCTNGAPRFASPLGPISVLPAVIPDPNDMERSIVLAGADNGRVQGFGDLRGDILWAFFTAGRLMGSAVVVDESRGQFIVADSDGRVYAASLLTGRPQRGDGTELLPYRAARCILSGSLCATDADCGTAEFCTGEVISAAGALGAEHFYVTTRGAMSETGTLLTPGALYAFSLEFHGGGPDWTFPLPPGGQSQSAPLVAIHGTREVVVFGADLGCRDATCDSGAVIAVADGELVWSIPLPDPVGAASPSVRGSEQGGVIYIGTAAGKLYQIQ